MLREYGTAERGLAALPGPRQGQGWKLACGLAEPAFDVAGDDHGAGVQHQIRLSRI